ncbi:MAG: amino acid permease [Cyanobacteria bacterium REEB67]|nr:amino acid permease [Cyanobacteria bacterium REEB67]
MKWTELFRRKSVSQIIEDEAANTSHSLSKVLTARDIFVAGLAAIIGTGIFILTGTAAHDFAGPSVILSFILAGMACAIVAFSYAEISSMIPISGSAYTYAYATMGELIAWMIGWDLVLEYAVGASCVAVGWSGYLQSLMAAAGYTLPVYLSKAPAHVPWDNVILAVGGIIFGIVFLAGYFSRNAAGRKPSRFPPAVQLWGGLAMAAFGLFEGVQVIRHLTSIDLLAVGIVALLSLWLMRGVKETMRMTTVFVAIKLVVIAIFIALGIWHINVANLHPFMPMGWQGMMTGAAVVFFAYIGFDGVTTLAEECKDPQSDLPKGIIGSLVVSTVLYVVVAAICVGAVSYTVLGGTGEAAPLAKVLSLIGDQWAVPLISAGALAGLTSVLLVSILAQSRLFTRMAKDGLMPAVFSTINPKYGTPRLSIAICAIVIAVAAGLLSVSELAILTNIGTLSAFVLVCIGVIVLRKTEPDRPRKFRCPGSPWVPALGALASFALMCCLPGITWIRFAVWMVIGLVIYFCYGRRNSKLSKD